MGLRVQAEADLGSTLEALGDFGFAFTLEDPSGTTANLVGMTGDIGIAIDPDTGIAVSGPHGTLTARISSMLTAGFTTLPEGVADPLSRPWVVTFNSINGVIQRWKVKRSMPDRTIGVVHMDLEFWKTA